MFGSKKKQNNGHIVCRHCGSLIPANSASCPECGSDSETGWRDDAYFVDYIQSEEEQEKPRKRGSGKPLKYVITILAAVAAASFIAWEFWPFGIYIGLVLIIVAAIGLVLFRERPLSGKKREKALEKELLSISGYDPARVERLVTYEKSRLPDASRTELLQNAIDRLLRDRNR
jgi:RNA polymerase subunit RPABC4/transcription elongation factor Spt4